MKGRERDEGMARGRHGKRERKRGIAIKRESDRGDGSDRLTNRYPT